MQHDDAAHAVTAGAASGAGRGRHAGAGLGKRRGPQRAAGHAETALAECRQAALAKIDLKPGPSGEARAYCLLAPEVARVLINLGQS